MGFQLLNGTDVKVPHDFLLVNAECSKKDFPDTKFQLSAYEDLEAGQSVNHEKYGCGTILEKLGYIPYEKCITVRFDSQSSDINVYAWELSINLQ